MKLWTQEKPASKTLIDFTVGDDRTLDLRLAPYDVEGTIAHITMLTSCGYLTPEELDILKTELLSLLEKIKSGSYEIIEGIEDIHSQVEYDVTKSLGDLGKKIHTARSRNDQVLLDLRMYFRDIHEHILKEVYDIISILIDKAAIYKDYGMPGYTHMQVAMPSSAGMWFSAHAESLIDDYHIWKNLYPIIDRNPLGTGAGYGSSFHIDRSLTTTLLSFNSLCVSSLYAQATRGKLEWQISQGISTISWTLSKIFHEICLFYGKNFDFFILPDKYLTGSSIMPHKKNPDVFEILRGESRKLMSIPEKIKNICGGLPIGYHRDLQVIKKIIFESIDDLLSILSISKEAMQDIKVQENILDRPEYDALFTVDRVHELVDEGLPFRAAYHQVSEEYQHKTRRFKDAAKTHTHIGSKDYLGLDLLKERLDRI